MASDITQAERPNGRQEFGLAWYENNVKQRSVGVHALYCLLQELPAVL